MPFKVSFALLLSGTIAGAAFAEDSSTRSHAGEVRVSGTVEKITCLQCVHWTGTGGVARSADRMVISVSAPIEYAGKRVSIFPWNDGVDALRPLHEGSQFSFYATPEGLGKLKVAVRYSEVEFATR